MALSLNRQLDTTLTFKYIKHELVSQGFDLSIVPQVIIYVMFETSYLFVRTNFIISPCCLG